jgi:hypothetical protein
MTNLHAIAARPRPRIKRIEITYPVARFAVQIERLLLDTSRNKEERVRAAVVMCRDVHHARRAKP